MKSSDTTFNAPHELQYNPKRLTFSPSLTCEPSAFLYAARVPSSTMTSDFGVSSVER